MLLPIVFLSFTSINPIQLDMGLRGFIGLLLRMRCLDSCLALLFPLAVRSLEGLLSSVCLLITRELRLLYWAVSFLLLFFFCLVYCTMTSVIFPKPFVLFLQHCYPALKKKNPRFMSEGILETISNKWTVYVQDHLSSGLIRTR